MVTHDKTSNDVAFVCISKHSNVQNTFFDSLISATSIPFSVMAQVSSSSAPSV